MMKWRTDMENAPTDGEVHVRGMWVYGADSGKPLYFDRVAGYVDSDGAFVYTCGDDCGWGDDAFTHWMPLPPPPEGETP